MKKYIIMGLQYNPYKELDDCDAFDSRELAILALRKFNLMNNMHPFVRSEIIAETNLYVYIGNELDSEYHIVEI